MKIRIRRVLIAIGVAALAAAPAAAQPAPALSIASPSHGQIVQRGATVDVVVNVTAPSALGDVFVAGEDPIGVSRGQPAGDSVTFSIVLPETIPAGEYSLVAVGARPGANAILSAPVRLVVPPPSGVTAIRVGNRFVRLEYPGAQMPLDVSAQSAATGSAPFRMPPQLLAFEVQDAAIATVDASGIVTGRTPGQTEVTVRYVSGSVTLANTASIEVGGARRGDLNGDDRVDLNDVNELTAWLNTPAIGATDGRDLNRDGRIDALDARVITTLCTQPRCAS